MRKFLKERVGYLIVLAALACIAAGATIYTQPNLGWMTFSGSQFTSITLTGADPTGVADSTAAFQAAFTAMQNAGNSVLVIPPGTYYQKTSANLPAIGENKFTIMGYGATIKTDQAITIWNRQPPDQTTADTWVNDRFFIAGVTFLGTQLAGQTGLNLGPSYGSRLDDLDFIDLDNARILKFCLKCMCNNNKFTNCLGTIANSIATVGDWSGGGRNVSASNQCQFNSERMYNWGAGQRAAWYIGGSDGVRLVDCITEGLSPTYDVEWDGLQSNSVNTVTVENMHVEHVSRIPGSVFYLKNDGGIVTLKNIFYESDWPAAPTKTATTIAFVAGTPATITDSGNGFLTAGFLPGNWITVSGSVSNNGSYQIATVTAGTITLATGETLTATGAGASVTITGYPGLLVDTSQSYLPLHVHISNLPSLPNTSGPVFKDVFDDYWEFENCLSSLLFYSQAPVLSSWFGGVINASNVDIKGQYGPGDPYSVIYSAKYLRIISGGLLFIQSGSNSIYTDPNSDPWTITGPYGAIFNTPNLTLQGSSGGLNTNFVEAESAALSGASGTISTGIPAGCRIIGVQLRVDTAITTDGATTWTAAYTNTPTTAIGSGFLLAKNTKFNAVHPAYEITTGAVAITVTPASGNFTAGVVRAIVYYESLSAMGNN